MSAFLVDRSHIVALIEAAASVSHRNHSSGLSWYHNGARMNLEYGGHASWVACGQMLWDENLRSIHARYPDTIGHPKNLPGTVGESYRIDPKDFRHARGAINPVRILKACDCYTYQSCEHEGWEASESHAFIEALRHKMIGMLPGYDDSPWHIMDPRPEPKPEPKPEPCGTCVPDCGCGTCPQESIPSDPNKLDNGNVAIAYDRDKKEVFLSDKTDHYNQPAAYTKTKRGLAKAWDALSAAFHAGMTLSAACDILHKCGVRTHYWCRVD
jgi:hypothetical protein